MTTQPQIQSVITLGSLQGGSFASLIASSMLANKVLCVVTKRHMPELCWRPNMPNGLNS